MFRETCRRCSGIYVWEYWISDNGYYDLPEIICEYKKVRNDHANTTASKPSPYTTTSHRHYRIPNEA